MNIQLLEPRKALNKAFLKINQIEMNQPKEIPWAGFDLQACEVSVF